jgi:alkylation response protein AidB-like acyl-CoA dehydrogenase
METTAPDVYAVPQEHLDLRDTIRQIVQERIAPRAAEIDAHGEYRGTPQAARRERRARLPFAEGVRRDRHGTL